MNGTVTLGWPGQQVKLHSCSTGAEAECPDKGTHNNLPALAICGFLNFIQNIHGIFTFRNKFK